MAPRIKHCTKGRGDSCLERVNDPFGDLVVADDEHGLSANYLDFVLSVSRLQKVSGGRSVAGLVASPTETNGTFESPQHFPSLAEQHWLMLDVLKAGRSSTKDVHRRAGWPGIEGLGGGGLQLLTQRKTINIADRI